MLTRFGDVNTRDPYGSTALHFAAMRGNEVAAATLLKTKGIEIDVGAAFGSKHDLQ